MSKRIKYPRTFHLPYSLTLSDDDKRLASDSIFSEMKVAVSEKMDGENTTIYSDGYIHARSLDGCKHPWQHWLKSYVQSWCYHIPTGWRVCGENLYAKHSIEYNFKKEEEFFQIFGIYNENNECLSWIDTIKFAQKFNLCVVPTFYIGIYNKDEILRCFNQQQDDNLMFYNNETEGFVIRNYSSFKYEDFSKNVAKYVRANHVQTNQHWTKSWTKNSIIHN